ncbi:MAG: TIGR03960 family B12-binding radical SAM protein [Nitrospirae bacterium]|nr:TIGR03960 family B12-binding radical SAM protein [Nitrospirota bacterium]
MSWRLIEKYRDILKQERGTICKEHTGRIRVAIIYPNTYYVGMSNLGFQTIYYHLNQRDDVVCERGFLPDEVDIEEFKRTNTALFSLESQKRLRDFDIIAFSVSFENDYINILKILDLAGIRYKKEERGKNEPLIIMGGVCAFFNPEPLTSFIDLIVVGEGEEVINEIMERYKEKVEEGKRETLKNMAQIEGCYVPELYDIDYNEDGIIKYIIPKDGAPERIKKRWIKDVDRYIAKTRVFTHNTEFENMLLVEIGRGCGRACRFCLEGYAYRPLRYRKADKVLAAVAEGEGLTKRTGFVGAAVSDYPYINEICIGSSGEISVSSLRADSVSEVLIKRLSESGHKTIAIAPEAGSERLRRVIKKDITEEDILKAARLILSNNIPNLKLYFMIGLPTETDEDINAIIDITKKVKEILLEIGRKKGQLGRITLSVSSFVPKPDTPFQWCRMDDVDSLNRKLKFLKKSISRIDNVFITTDVPKWAYTQGILSRGDRRVGNLIESAYKADGDWKRAIREAAFNGDFYAIRERRLDEMLPWSYIDVGVKKELLIKEYNEAIANS